MYSPLFYGMLLPFLFIINVLFNKNVVLIITFIIFVLLLSFRGEVVGNDTHTYISIFESLSSTSSNFFTENKEFLFIKLNMLLSEQGFSYSFLFFVCALLSLLPFYLMISKYSDSYSLSISIFCSIGPFLFMHSGMRQGVSIGLFYLVLYFYLNKRYLLSIISFFASLNFHTSSIVSAIFLIFKKKKNEFFLYITLLLSSLIAFFPSMQSLIFKLLFFLVPSKYIELVTFQLSENVSSLGLRNIFLSLMCVILIFSTRRTINSNEIMIINISIFGILLNNFFSSFDLLSRVVAYFTPALCIAIPISYSLLFKGKNRLYADLLTIIVFIFFLQRTILTDNLRIFNV
ncbi:EpsG family protein [Aliivibrio fischeri]|uniref:EpsG family protein n=1 Tax=Aliivibrio fischeri TaxID=668 RepID=UPI0012D9DBC4|nr:EpsG family protein [Aliivibrio fischeri]MUI52513.1 hypothetical protein [Aliivibrio fischeri]